MIRNLKIYCWRSLLFICSISIFLPGCKIDIRPKIALMFPYTTASRMKIEGEAFKRKAIELGAEAIITDALSNERLQMQQADSVINEGVKVIVLMSVNVYTAAGIVRHAHEHNIKVIAYDRIIKNCLLDYYISFDNIKVGQLMAEYAIKFKPEGKYIILAGDKSDQNAIWVRQGQLNVLKQLINNEKINIVYDTFIEDWAEDNAEFITKEILRLGDITPDVILTSYDGLARGAIKALQQEKYNSDCIITGQDAEPESLKLIESGAQTMTIYKPVQKLGEKAAEIAMKMIKKELVENNLTIDNGRALIPSMLLESIVVDKNNVRSIFHENL